MNIKTVWMLVLPVVMLSSNVATANKFDNATVVSGVGFDKPETVLHDAATDTYLVSNVSGHPSAKDDTGFISKVSPEGKVIDLKWIDGVSEDVTLHSPKGMVVHGEQLYIADIDTIRVFDRNTGKPLKNIVIEGATFLNDVVVAENGELYTSESALVFKDGKFQATGLDSIFKISKDDEVSTWVSGTHLGQPNGLEMLSNGDLVAVTRGGNNLYTLDPSGKQVNSFDAPGKVLDGVVRLKSGDYLLTSWQTSALYRLDADKQFTEEAKLPVPAANIGYDYQRDAVLLPLLKQDEIAFIKMD